MLWKQNCSEVFYVLSLFLKYHVCNKKKDNPFLRYSQSTRTKKDLKVPAFFKMPISFWQSI